MICNNCHKQIDEDSKFCTFCGAKQEKQVKYTNGNLVPFKQNNKWGYKDKNTRDIIVQPKYTNAGEVREKRAIVEINKKHAVVDENGNELCPFKYDYIADFSEGFARVKRDNLWTFIDINCNLLASFKYNDLTDFKNGIARETTDKQCALINTKGETISAYYDKISEFTKDIAIVEKKNKLGIIDISGKELLPCIFDSIGEFKDGISYTNIENKYGIINDLGEEKLKCEYSHIYNFQDGFAKILRDSKLGMIDSKGNLVLPCEYDEFEYLENGFQIITKDGKCGLFNAGKLILPTDYKKIRFIKNDSIAAKNTKSWKCFNYNGKEISQTNDSFKRFKRRKKIIKNLMRVSFVILLFIVVGVFDYLTNELGVLKKTQSLIFGSEYIELKEIIEHPHPEKISFLIEYIDRNEEYKELAIKAINELLQWNTLSKKTIHIDGNKNTISILRLGNNYYTLIKECEKSSTEKKYILSDKFYACHLSDATILKEAYENKDYYCFISFTDCGNGASTFDVNIVEPLNLKFTKFNYVCGTTVAGKELSENTEIKKYPKYTNMVNSILKENGYQIEKSEEQVATNKWFIYNKGIYNIKDTSKIDVIEISSNLFNESQKKSSGCDPIENHSFYVISMFKGGVYYKDKLYKKCYILWLPESYYDWIDHIEFEDWNIIRFKDRNNKNTYKVNVTKKTIHKIN